MAIQDYITLAQVKAYMPTNEVSTSSIWDTMVTTLCNTTSRLFDLLTWRNPGDFKVQDSVIKYFDGNPPTKTDYWDILSIGELAEAPTLVQIDGNTVLSTNYWTWPYNAALDFVPITALRLNPAGTLKSWQAQLRGIAITGKFGYSTTVPPDVYEAMLLFVVKYVRKAQQNYMDSGTILDSGQIMQGMKEDADLSKIIEYRKRPRLASASPSSATVRW